MELAVCFHSYTKTRCTINALNMTIISIGVQQHQTMTLIMSGVTAYVSISFLIPIYIFHFSLCYYSILFYTYNVFVM